jgi:CheY-like chemotaxis protein
VLESLDFNELVAETSHLLHTSIPEGVEIVNEFASEALPVKMDATQIRQVVMNLVLNAAEAIEDEVGQVTLRTGLTHAGCETSLGADRAAAAQGPYVYLDVEDTGCGMDATTRSRIFDPFFSTKFAGRGLGLAAVRGILQGHGGGLEVQSELGQGSTFRVLLPKSEEPAPATPGHRSAVTEFRAEGRVLVVDDEEAVRGAVARMVEGFGYEVVTAADGREALEIFGRDPDGFQVVLLDIVMPHMTGTEALRELRALRPELPIVMMSGYAEENMAARVESDPKVAFLAKPFKTRDLSARIREVLAST